MNRNTKQKETILETLRYNKQHPTILELYHDVYRKDTSIGQATIYRNINKLVSENLIKQICIDGNVTRYDGNMGEHIHFYCENCHNVFDIFDFKLDFSTLENKERIKIISESVLLKGICSSCSNNKN